MSANTFTFPAPDWKEVMAKQLVGRLLLKDFLPLTVTDDQTTGSLLTVQIDANQNTTVTVGPGLTQGMLAAPGLPVTIRHAKGVEATRVLKPW